MITPFYADAAIDLRTAMMMTLFFAQADTPMMPRRHGDAYDI